MKYKICSIRINVTKYDVTFATKLPQPSPTWLRHWLLELRTRLPGSGG